jgi:hypothetical protein
VVLYLPGVTQQDLNNATIFAGSEYHHVECILKDAETGKMACHVPGKYAGEDVTLYVAGQMFYATVPNPNTPAGEETPTCPEGEVLSYTYIAYYYGEYDWNSYAPVWLWEEWTVGGSFEYWETLGYTYEITGTFCAEW